VDDQRLTQEIGDQDRLLLVFAYLGPLALFSLVASRKEFVKWHAKQGVLLSVTVAVVWVAGRGVYLLLRDKLIRRIDGRERHTKPARLGEDFGAASFAQRVGSD